LGQSVQPGRDRSVLSRALPGTVPWGVALSLGLHAAALSCLLMVHHALTPGRDIGAVELVMVQPAPSGTAAAHGAATSPDAAADHAPDEVPPPPAVPDQPVVPPQDTAPAQQAAGPPPPVPDRQPAPDQADATQPAPLPPPAAQPQAPTAAPVLPESPPPAPRPVRTPRPPSRVTMRASPPLREPAQRAQSEDASAVTAPSAGTSAASAPSSGPTQQTAHAGADPDWLAGVGAWLRAHRSYPEMARALGRQGTVVVQITVNPAGRVVGVNLVQGSGTDSLDRAAEALMRDAQLPPFPPDMKLPRQSLTVPIRYVLE
jgi:protein TonB